MLLLIIVNALCTYKSVALPTFPYFSILIAFSTIHAETKNGKTIKEVRT